MFRMIKGPAFKVIRSKLISLIMAMIAAVAPLPPTRAQVVNAKLSGLMIVEAERKSIEGKSGIEITFDKPSADRLLRFTRDAVGRHIVFIVNQRKLASLRLLDPIVDGRILLTGDLDAASREALFSAGATIDLELER
jgi:hypothetical protein